MDQANWASGHCMRRHPPSGLTHTRSALLVLGLVPGRWCRSGQAWASRGRAIPLLGARLPCVCPQAGSGPHPQPRLSCVEEDKSGSSFLTPHLLSHPSGACCSLLCASSQEILTKMLEHPFAHSPFDAETHLLSGVTVSMRVVGRWSGRSR